MIGPSVSHVHAASAVITRAVLMSSFVSTIAARATIATTSSPRTDRNHYPYDDSNYVMDSPLTHVHTASAPAPVGAYSQAVKYGDTVYLSGALGLDVNTGKLVEGGAGPQTKRALENIQKILEASQSSYSSVVKTTVLLADIKDGPTVNEIYKQFFVHPYPARAMFQAANLPLGAKVEIEVIAAVKK